MENPSHFVLHFPDGRTGRIFMTDEGYWDWRFVDTERQREEDEGIFLPGFVKGLSQRTWIPLDESGRQMLLQAGDLLLSLVKPQENLINSLDEAAGGERFDKCGFLAPFLRRCQKQKRRYIPGIVYIGMGDPQRNSGIGMRRQHGVTVDLSD